jgi:hypothetical protein
MSKTLRKLPSGLYVVEDAPPPKPPQETITCAVCHGTAEVDREIIARHKRSNGWTHHRPCCKHAPFYRCVECGEKHHGCPECGEQAEYT